jgi:hypothetical protein
MGAVLVEYSIALGASRVDTPPPSDSPATCIKDLENRVEREQRGTDARLLLVERALSATGAGSAFTGFRWDKVPEWVQAAAAVATPVMVVLVGEWLTGSLDRAIQQQQADISGVKEMRAALVDLYAAEPEKATVASAALSIASFGSVSAAPLIEAFDRGGAAREEAARRGLIAASTHDKTRVCAVLASVSGSDNSLYRPETTKFAAELQKAMRC